MPLTVDQIPDHGRPRPGAAGSTALTGLTVPARRRAVLRGLVLGALTVGASALNWSGAIAGRPARAEVGRYGLQGWDRTDCHDAYPAGYDQLSDTSGDYVNTYAACFGGTWRGSDFCEAGWHKFGTWMYGDVRADHVPISSSCGATATKNAWRWTTPDGVTYRCSDGYTTFWSSPDVGQTYGTICRSALP